MNGQISDLLFTFIIIGIPECIAVTILALTLLRQLHQWGKVWLIGILLACTVLACRVLIPINGIPGVHSAVATIILALLITVFYRIPKHQSLIASIVCMVFITVVEFLVYLLFKWVLGLDIGAMINQKPLWITASWLHIIAAAVTAYAISKTKWHRGSIKINGAR